MKRSTLYCSLLFLLFQSSLFSQQPNYHWIKKMEVIRAEDFYFEPIDHLVVDSRGNVYRLIVFSEEAVLEDTTITAGIGNSFLLIKHNSQGKMEWVRKIVGFDEEEDTDWGWVSSICLDPQENIVIGGDFWTSEVDFGNGERLVNSCTPEYCENLFAATYSPQGKLIETLSFSLPEDNEALYPILNVDSRGRKTFSFFTDASELNIGSEKISLNANMNFVNLQLSSDHQLEQINSLHVSENSFFAPYNSISDKDGSLLVFGNINGLFTEHATLSDNAGFSYTITLPERQGGYNKYLLYKQNANGNPEWGLDVASSAGACQMAADSNGNVYLLGFFGESLLVQGKIVFENQDELTDGYILKIGADGKIIWQKHLKNVAIPMYETSLVSAFPGSFSSDGGLLVPILAISDTPGELIKIDDKEIRPSYQEIASGIAYFSPNGHLDTLISIEVEEGVLVGSSCRFDNKGRIYAMFLALEMDSLKVGAYRYAVEQEYTEFLACFSLDKQLPGINFPVVRTRYDRDIRIRLSPNPTSDKVEVRWEPQETPANITLRDAVGRQLEVLKVDPLAVEASFDLSKYVTGVYFIEWQGKNTFHSAKIIKH